MSGKSFWRKWIRNRFCSMNVNPPHPTDLEKGKQSSHLRIAQYAASMGQDTNGGIGGKLGWGMGKEGRRSRS